VQVSYPEGMRGVYEGQVNLERAAGKTTLGGQLTMLLGAYEKNFDWSGRTTRTYGAATDLILPENVFLDLQVGAEGNVWLRNDLAKVESSFDIHVGGTLRRPEVTGRLWLVEGGKVVYRDVDYRLTDGSLDFVELDRLNPYMTLRAETTVKDYTVFLRVEGTLDHFEYELTSDPTLTPQDIIALLTTGSTLEEITGTTTGGTPFTGDLAANYFSGALTAPFTNQLERVTGLETVRIDPFLTAGDADPTTRLTLGKDVTSDAGQGRHRGFAGGLLHRSLAQRAPALSHRLAGHTTLSTQRRTRHPGRVGRRHPLHQAILVERTRAGTHSACAARISRRRPARPVLIVNRELRDPQGRLRVESG